MIFNSELVLIFFFLRKRSGIYFLYPNLNHYYEQHIIYIYIYYWLFSDLFEIIMYVDLIKIFLKLEIKQILNYKKAL